jgi:hypothetical protein
MKARTKADITLLRRVSCYLILDHLARRHPVSASQGGPCAADRFYQQYRWLIADRAMRPHLVVVSTPSLAFPDHVEISSGLFEGIAMEISEGSSSYGRQVPAGLVY